jgi:hypothetical protein
MMINRPLPQAVLTLQTQHESRQQRTARGDIVDYNVFVRGVRAVARHAQAIEYRHAQRANEVPIRCSADAGFA